MDRLAERGESSESGDSMSAADALSRCRLRITGTVQGVGFRPFIYRLAQAHRISGFILNGPEGVAVEAQGPLDQLDRFAAAITPNAPPLARIASIYREELAPQPGEGGFLVKESERGSAGALVPADVAPCPACIAEVFDPRDRRYLYPFTTCTDCGPRLAILEAVPYDRARTTMRGFPLCPACEAEYRDPASRRFHAEAIACPHCGPQLSHSISEMVAVIAKGGIVALKGLGGFHLACDATSEAAVTQLRARKRRDAKPFAVMVENLNAAERYGCLKAAEGALLQSRERPIVIVKARQGSLAPSVSSGLDTVGLMLPSSMLHLLLLREAAGQGISALVMTSGNLSGEPVLIDDAAAREKLAAVADLIVTHTRPIANRADDSVIRLVDDAPAFIRRSRGSVPATIALSQDGPDILALGGHLKVTACALKGKTAHLSAHIGDLESAASIKALEEAADSLIRLTGLRPQAIAHDLHPDFASTVLAKRLAKAFDCPAIAVQHHHAHAAAQAEEHGLTSALAITLDGFGLGPQGDAVRAWGGEVLLYQGAACTRLGTLMPLLEPGGDKAAREPWRMALPILMKLGLPAASFAEEPQAADLEKLVQQGAITSATTSAGRLFDAVAALLSIVMHNRFEAEAAMRLEGLAAEATPYPGGFTLMRREDGVYELSLMPLLEKMARGCNPQKGAAWLHGTLAEGLAELVSQYDLKMPVVLSGGCFLNSVLTTALRQNLEQRGHRVLTARQVPCNDGGLSFGQAVIARNSLCQ